MFYCLLDEVIDFLLDTWPRLIDQWQDLEGGQIPRYLKWIASWDEL